jgi:hypothetical protein
MKLELSKDDANSIGAILVALKNSRLLDNDKQAMTCGEFMTLYTHVDKVYKLRERILKADEGGIGTGKQVDNKSEKVDKKPPKPEKKVGAKK